ncbi:MAG: ATP-binding protein [Chloroflexi bacterium]|nr:ATP-binding protein [Chloroflexota bacterium]
MLDFLLEIRSLFESGAQDDALDLLQLHLDAHPHDADALILKITFCLHLKQQHEFVGNTLLELDPAPQRTELMQRRDALVKDLLREGREHLKTRSPFRAYDPFDKAALLAPREAYVPLAAGLALLRHPHNRADSPFGGLNLPPLGSGLAKAPSTGWSGAVEKYFRAAHDRATDDAMRERAIHHLVKHWLAQDKITQEALSLLLEIKAPQQRTLKVMADAADEVEATTLATAAVFLTAEHEAVAERFLKACERARVRQPFAALLRAELALQDPATAIKHFQTALKWSKAKRTAITLRDAKMLLLLVQETPLICPHCGKEASISLDDCGICGSKLAIRPLVAQRYGLDVGEATHSAVIAHVGMAEAYEKVGDLAAAYAQAQLALTALPADHQSAPTLRALVTRLESGAPPTPDQTALKAYALFRQGGLNAETLLQIGRINERQPADWTVLPTQQRTRLVKALIAAGQLKLAAETIDAAFADKPKSVPGLRAALTAQIEAEIAALLDDPPAPEALITAASKLLELQADADLFYARGMARLATEHDLLALDDFYSVMQSEAAKPLKTRARKQAVGVLERRWNIEGARSILDQLDPRDPDVQIMRERLDRRENGEPVVHIEAANEVVMEDTLTRKAAPPFYHGFFAVAVREIGFPGGGDWYQKLMTAHYEFVQVLGALRDVMGDAIFVLRLISQPHPLIPERGSMTVALLARVSAPTPEICRAHALQLWTDMHAILPLAQENIYIFEPVVDEDELRGLLTPFEYAHTAEIARRETDANETKFIAPFTPGTFDIHNLHWVFLRQSQPAMISLHLKPTNLLPWEKLTTAQALHRAGAAVNDDPSAQPVTPEGFKMISRVQLWEELRQTHAHNNTLKFAYLLRVYIAGSAGTSQLLPEMAAAALFGPVRDAGTLGGYEILRATSADEASVLRRNLSRLDVEAAAGGSRMRYLVAETEAANIFRLPVPQADGIPGMVKLEGRPVVPPAGMPDTGARLGVSAARVKGVPMAILQGLNDRRRHMYVVGKTGMGKSTLLMTLILQDIEAGRGVFLLDPHGDLCEDVLARIPAYRADDVIVLDPSEEARPLGINILESENEADKYRIVNEFIAMLQRLYDPHNQAIVGPIFQQTVRNAMLAAMSMPDGTLVDVYRIISDNEYIKRVLPFIKDPLVKAYYEDIVRKMSGASDHWKAELLPYLLSKFSRFVEDATLRRMIGQPRTSIPWPKVIEEQKILLVNLAKGRIGQDNASFIGGLVLSGMLQAAFKRGNMPANKRKDFFMYIDEVQNFSTPMLATMLSEGRKFGVVMTIANQFLHQLDRTILEAVFGNVGSMVAFRLGTQDAPALAPEMYPSFSGGDLINLPQFTAAVKLMVDGVAARPFTMKTLPPMRPPDRASAEAIRRASGLRYGSDMALVQQTIMGKF